MITYALQVSLVWIVLFIIYFLFLRKETLFNTNRSFLLFSLISGLALPYFAVYFQANEVVPSLNVYLEEINEIVISPQESDIKSFDFYTLLLIIYFIGFAITFSKMIYGLTRIAVMYIKGDKSKKVNFTFVETDGNHLPFSFLNAIFVSKNVKLEKYMEEVIHHELCHISSWHSIDILFVEILNVIFWFNPILLFYKTELKACHEYAADRMAVKYHSKESYSMLLIGQTPSGIELALSNQFFNSLIKNRIKMLYKKQSDKKAIVKYAIAAPLILLFLFSFSPAKKIFTKDEIVSISQDTTKQKVYETVDEMPVFPVTKEYNGLFDFVLKNMKYPAEARTKAIEGKVIASFVVNVDGKMKDIEIVNESNPLLEQESKRLLELMASQITWQPGKIKNENVNVKMHLPLQFKLDDKKSDADNKADKINADEVKVNKLEDEKVGEIVFPLFPGTTTSEASFAKIMSYLKENLKYPAIAKENGVEDKVILSFGVDKEGKIIEIKILKSLTTECGAEVLRIINKLKNEMGNWTPGTIDGKIETVSMTIPVAFRLSENEKKNLQNPYFSISPNPTNDVIKIKAGEVLKTNLQIEIIDANGKVVKSTSLNTGEVKEVNVNSFANGTYYARAIIGNETVTSVFVVAK